MAHSETDTPLRSIEMYADMLRQHQVDYDEVGVLDCVATSLMHAVEQYAAWLATQDAWRRVLADPEVGQHVKHVLTEAERAAMAEADTALTAVQRVIGLAIEHPATSREFADEMTTWLNRDEVVVNMFHAVLTRAVRDLGWDYDHTRRVIGTRILPAEMRA